MSLEIEVAVPATSANLGPGYDSFGMALDISDVVVARWHAEPLDPASVVTVTGEGAATLPRNEDHLIHRVVAEVLAAEGRSLDHRLSLHAVNAIPHSRGLGSSASAVVAGIAIADALGVHLGLAPIPAARKLAWATHFEGHPDNAAPALFGGVTLSYTTEAGPASVSVPVHPKVTAVVVVPEERLDTKVARGLIPATVPHAEAAANSATAGLFVHAISHDPTMLLEATVDRLHQEYRRPAMPEALARVDALREVGLAAFVSGAGPTVAVLGTRTDLGTAVSEVLGRTAARIIPTRIADTGAATTVTSPAEMITG